MVITTKDQLKVFLRDRRNELGLTQKNIMDEAGIRQATISQIEKDPSKMTFETFWALCNALNLRLALEPKQNEKDFSPEALFGASEK